jgi:hypothetical protein
MPFSYLRYCGAIFQPSRAAKRRLAVPILTHFSLYDLLRLSGVRSACLWAGLDDVAMEEGLASTVMPEPEFRTAR